MTNTIFILINIHKLAVDSPLLYVCILINNRTLSKELDLERLKCLSTTTFFLNFFFTVFSLFWLPEASSALVASQVIVGVGGLCSGSML